MKTIAAGLILIACGCAKQQPAAQNPPSVGEEPWTLLATKNEQGQLVKLIRVCNTPRVPISENGFAWCTTLTLTYPESNAIGMPTPKQNNLLYAFEEKEIDPLEPKQPTELVSVSTGNNKRVLTFYSNTEKTLDALFTRLKKKYAVFGLDWQTAYDPTGTTYLRIRALIDEAD